MTDTPKKPATPANPATPAEKLARAAAARDRINAELQADQADQASPAKPANRATPANRANPANEALLASAARDRWYFEHGEQPPDFEEAQEPDEQPPPFEEPPKPNGHDQEPPPYDEDTLEVFDIGSMAELPIPPRQYLDGHKFLLMHTTHVLAGDGGAGKTELVCQLAIGCCGYGKWLNLPVAQGPVLFFSAEEPVTEIRRRVHHLCNCLQLHPSALKGLFVIDATEKSAWLFEENLKTKRMATTARWEWLVGKIAMVRPKVVIVDNRMRIFAGNQNDSVMAVTSIAMLDRIARLYDCVIILVSHPSLSQMSTGRGDSGSVAWSNAARSRSYLHHPALDRNLITDGDDGQRRLTSMKANATKSGIFVEFLWDEGLGFFKCIYEPPRADDGIGVQSKAERVFLNLLRWHTAKGMEVSHNANARAKYAPTVFVRHSQREGLSIRWFETAMEALFHQGKIEIRQRGPASKLRDYLAEVDHNL